MIAPPYTAPSPPGSPAASARQSAEWSGTSTSVDATLTVATDDELRRRAAEGDERALVERARRQAEEIRAA